MLEAGASYSEIGRRFGVHHTTVMVWLGKGQSSATQSFDRDRARQLHADGLEYGEIAVLLGVSRKAVYAACNLERKRAWDRQYRANQRRERAAA